MPSVQPSAVGDMPLAMIGANIARTLELTGDPADRFQRLFLCIVKMAHNHNQTPHRKQPRVRDVRPYFERLRKALLAVQSFGEKPDGSDPDWHGEAAGCYVEAIKPGWIAEAIDIVDRAEGFATINTGTRLPGGRGASAVEPAFRIFLAQLFGIESGAGFEWTAYKDRLTGRPAGSLIEAMVALEANKHLPSGFVPQSGQTMLRTINDVRKSIRMNPTK